MKKKNNHPKILHLSQTHQKLNKKSIIKEPAASSTFSNSCAVELNACLSSHLPMKYQLIPCQVSIPNYSRIPPTVGIDDPRLRHSIIAAKDSMLIQNAPLTVRAVNVRPNDPHWKPMADRDPRQWHRFNMGQRINYINYF
ncbi:unnamed protein product [Aphis gossypii]|uniref:Uncharacterized protein n=1 Tax=Aphis gossypii TaxID=80765 RepID=A0A9P0NDZ1_APHGO|nr:unnamed protein product [Aphis gossypii]